MQAHVSILSALLCLGAFNGTLAQPGDLHIINLPCNLPPDMSIDLNGDGVIDLELVGRQEGTDDVPSSYGWCSRSVRGVNGTRLLHMAERTSQGEITLFARHDTLPDPGLENDHLLPQHQWIDAEITVLAWPYGSAMREPDQRVFDAKRPVFVVRVPGGDGPKLVAVLVDVNEALRQVSIMAWASAPEGEDLRW